MCGIAAIITHDPDPGYKAVIMRMTDLVRHRGPDNLDTVSLFDGMVHLGHSRLSIIDISEEANQPMSLASDEHWIVYNGEVYNYIELRAELERLGHTFNTQSDTEVILKAYHEWGTDCLKQFNGMFAFAIVDKKRRKLFAARDRLGVKPLYCYTVPGKLFALASEIKQFTALPSFKPQINSQLVYDYLAHGMLDHTHRTMFRQVCQLQGGQCMEVNLDPADSAFAYPLIQTWWTLPECPIEPSISLEEATREFRDLLEDSVRLRLRSDVPLGSCLSGGLDSSSIVCMVNSILGKEKSSEIQKTFSSCFEDRRYDERIYIEEVIARTRVESHYTFPDPEILFTLLDTITWHQDEPFGSASIFAQWHVFELARKFGVKVMLDGQGADELLGGYQGYFGSFLAGLVRSKHFSDLMNELKEIRGKHAYHLKDILIRLGYIFSPQWVRSMGRALVGRPDIPEWMDADIIRDAGIMPAEAINEPGSSIRSLSREQLLHTNLPALLHYEDRNSMAHSVEARVPFLDYRLVEFGYSLPDRFKIKDGETKKILRLSMKDIVPEKVINRQDKMAFATPEQHWVRESYNKHFRTVLKETSGHLGPWINQARLEDMFRSVTAGSKAFDWSIWRIINAGTWARLFHMDFRDVA